MVQGILINKSSTNRTIKYHDYLTKHNKIEIKREETQEKNFNLTNYEKNWLFSTATFKVQVQRFYFMTTKNR